MKKVFISADALYAQCFALAKKIHTAGFIPEYMLILMRGGAVPGIIIHEYFRKKGITISHGSITSVSYKEMGKQSNVVFHGLSSLKRIQKKKILIVDDVFDTGKTIETLLSVLDKSNKVKIATVFFKSKANKTKLKPDFYVKKTAAWIVFPHESQ
ncbi:hypoxanthine phosphoribosyltransferase [Candidatus Woesearchaeota archaeon]|nr:MAG: hypoxanthine phosphoribosyltransferase [Candidatus Woesearchaeota archaeon]